MKSEKEIWKPVVGLEDRYMISSLGMVKSLAYDIVDSIGRHVHRKEKLMKVKVCSSTGYPQVNLWVGEKNKPFSIHRLTAEAFIPNPNNYPCVNHIDEDRSNSVLGNLEWCTYGYNTTYGSARERRRAAVMQFDYPLIMGITMFTALLVVLGNLLADVLYAVFDPRIRKAGC